MGSWSETCFASNLPIHENGCHIVALPVIQVQGTSAIRPVKGNYMAVGVPVRGVYDTYGGVELDPEEEALLAPLKDAIAENLPNVPYKLKNVHRDTLRGIGVRALNEDLHKDLPYNFAGDSAWLQFDFGAGPKHYPVYWAFMRLEVYDHILSQVVINNEPDLRRSMFEYFNSLGVPEITEEDLLSQSYQDLGNYMDLDRMLRSMRVLLNNLFTRWLQEYFQVKYDKPLTIQHYLHKDLPQDTRDRIIDLMRLFVGLYNHRIQLHRSDGPQFGQYEKHRAFHLLCLDLIQADDPDLL